MTKANSAPSAAPRRSTRAKTKRLVDSDSEGPQPGAPAVPQADQKSSVQKHTKRARAAKPSTKAAKAAQQNEPIDISDSDSEPAPNKRNSNPKAPKPLHAAHAKHPKPKPAKSQAGKQVQAEPQDSDAAAAEPAKVKQLSGKQPAAADPACPKAHTSTVAGDFDVMLNQTNIGANNNKFYRMQLLQEGSDDYWLWTKWGRVGDKGQTQLKGPFDADQGPKEFKKQFRSKVGAAFEDKHGARQVRSGKYSLVDLDSFSPPPTPSGASKPAAKITFQHEESKLEKPTEELMNLIFSDIMFQQAMQEFDIDTEKLPLGQLSQDQVQRGYDVLERLRAAINGGGQSLAELSSEFYQVIPHNFGRQRPPVIASLSIVEHKIRMCDVLSDIEVAQDMVEASQQEDRIELQPHPADEKYATLMADLKVIPAKEEEYKIIQQYCQATGSGQQLLDVWRVDRRSEAAGFAAHSQLDNRRLLWHGTNIAVVAAILKAGLRIMPHACGRVGRGLYLASEQSKSAAYVTSGRRGSDYIGVMFLAEAALGQEHHIIQDDSSLREPPPGFHSVVARGHTEPDPSKDVKLELEGNSVQVPQGKPIHMPQFQKSTFAQSEYLLYQESQARIRYMLTMKFSHAGNWH